MPKSRNTEIVAVTIPKNLLSLIDRYSGEDRLKGNRSAAVRELVVLGLREVKRARRKGKPVRPVLIDFTTGKITLWPVEPTSPVEAPPDISSEERRRKVIMRQAGKRRLREVHPPITREERKKYGV